MGKLSAVLFASTIIAQSSFAEVIKIPVSKQAVDRQSLILPRHGQSKQAVEKQFGTPQVINAAVGKPPISSWQYADHIVYFEYNRVLHSVLKYRAQHPTDSE